MKNTRGAGSRVMRAIGPLVACAVTLLIPCPLGAQDAPPSPPPAHRTAPQPDEASTPRTTRLYVGMWTTHLKDDAIVLDNNWVVGLSARGYFGATFLNSFGRRAFAGGLQRTIVASDPAPIGASLGVRLGLITGYDGRLMRIARDTPVLPLIQPFATLDVQRIGFEVSFTFVVVSVAVSYGF
jgi:hypothetical protein